MSDLISRKAVITTIHNYFHGLIDKGMHEIDVVDCNAELCKEVDNIEVAYNMDKVVEQLQQMKTRYFLAIANTGNETLDKIYEDVGNSIDKAIEIVKGAVKDESNTMQR